MKTNKKFEQRYLKYVVKSPLLFTFYMAVFVTVFLIMTNSLQLEVRKSYVAQIFDNEVHIAAEMPLVMLDDKIYAYTDKNREVFIFLVASTDYKDGTANLILSESQEKITGAATVEIISEQNTLFETIFTKAGTKR